MEVIRCQEESPIMLISCKLLIYWELWVFENKR